MGSATLSAVISILLMALPFAAAQDVDLSQLTIQELIALGESDLIAERIVGSNDVPFLADSFTFPAADKEMATQKSANRSNDPDVVVFKALAKAALTPQQSRKLSNVAWLSVFPWGGATLGDVTKLLKDLNDDFSNVDLMTQILESDPNKDFIPSQNLRKLLCDGCSPANSYVCSNCWPSKVCGKYFWCPKKG